MNIEKFRGYEDFEANPTVKKNTDNTKNDTENVGEHVDASRNTAEKPEQDKERTLLREQQKNRLDTLRTVEAQQNSLDRGSAEKLMGKTDDLWPPVTFDSADARTASYVGGTEGGAVNRAGG